MRPEVGLLGLMDKLFEKKSGNFVFIQYVITADALLYAQRWKDSIFAHNPEWLVKMMEFPEMAKLRSWSTEKTISVY